MERTNKKECPKCGSSKINIVSKIENGDAIIRPIGSQAQPEFVNVFYQCQCNECGEPFEYWPAKN